MSFAPFWFFSSIFLAILVVRKTSVFFWNLNDQSAYTGTF